MARNQDANDQNAQAAERQDFLRDAADMGTARLGQYATYRDAYAGDMQVRLTDRQRQYLQRNQIPWSENFCETVVDWKVDRMVVEGFEADLHTETDDAGEEQAEKDLAAVVNGWWQSDRMDETQAVIHEETKVCGDAFVIVDWNTAEQRPRFTYNRPEMIKPVYSEDQPDQLEYVSKVWNSKLEGQRIRRLNLFYPDRIEKWFTYAVDGDNAAHWHAFVDADDYEQLDGQDGPVDVPVWPIPWLDAAGAPLGIPVVHFRNKPGAHCMGRSDLRSVIPQNEALNKLIQDSLDIIDYLGAPVPFATGIEGTFDATFVAGEWKTTTDKDAKFGVLPGADPKGVLDAIRDQLQRMAARSKTPLHALSDAGDLPSGEALKAAEAAGVKGILRDEVPAGNSHARCQEIGVRLANAFGAAGLPEGATFQTCWENAETRNEQAEATTAGLLHDIGVSRYTLMQRLGFDPEREKELRASEAAEDMERQAAMLDKGIGAGPYGGAPAADAPTKPDPANQSPKVPG